MTRSGRLRHKDSSNNLAGAVRSELGIESPSLTPYIFDNEHPPEIRRGQMPDPRLRAASVILSPIMAIF
jgi:hypothetical protein